MDMARASDLGFCMLRRTQYVAALLAVLAFSIESSLAQVSTRVPSEPVPSTPPETRATPPETPAAHRSRLPGVATWAYQLQNVDLQALAASPYDLVVIDYSRSADDGGRYTPEEIGRLKRKPDGGRRIVLAYLSIGEAESYRSYWREGWVEPLTVILGPVGSDRPPAGRNTDQPPRPATGKPRVVHVPSLTAPPWLGMENPSWPANYLVRYWEKAWQDIIFGKPSAELDRLVTAGFDGVYLDRVDAYLSARARPGSRAEMVQFVLALARHARSLRPAFAIVPQNAEELLADPEYLAAIDGIAKEDLFHGQGRNDEEPNPDAVARNSVSLLEHAKRQGRPVFVVEYVRAPQKIAAARQRILEHGFVPYFSVRALDQLMPLETALPPANSQPPGRPQEPKR